MATPQHSDAARWQAVTARDRTADGTFYYAVKTTGVYCRPSCAARLPLRENVTFYEAPEAARAAGYRPCKRCRPDDAPLAERHAAAIARACRELGAADGNVDLDRLAASLGMSRFHFQRVFKGVTGVTPHAYQRARRAQRLREGLPASESVTEAVYAAGFNSSGRFYAEADAALGMRPAAYRAGGAGAAIRFAVGECSLGSILVAASERGVCAILLGDDPEALTQELQDLFPNARLSADDPEFDRWVADVVGFVEAPGTGLALPLDVRGTAFQQRVWQALRCIPIGTTMSYAALAERIGKPSATRAVAAACAANKLAVAIPCHRVVRKDGGVSGYRWGVERKRALLARESTTA